MLLLLLLLLAALFGAGDGLLAAIRLFFDPRLTSPAPCKGIRNVTHGGRTSTRDHLMTLHWNKTGQTCSDVADIVSSSPGPGMCQRAIFYISNTSSDTRKVAPNNDDISIQTQHIGGCLFDLQ